MKNAMHRDPETSNERCATRTELANSLFDLSDRAVAASRGGGTLREALEAAQAAKDGILESMASMRNAGEEQTPEYRSMQQVLDYVVKAHAALDSAAKAAKRFGYV